LDTHGRQRFGGAVVTTRARWLWVVALGCGIPLVVVATVGGAGLGAFFGTEGFLVLGALAAVAATAVRRALSSHRDGEPTN
jgi:uncharacterized membrane protein